jgi:hypothetical protein
MGITQYQITHLTLLIQNHRVVTILLLNWHLFLVFTDSKWMPLKTLSPSSLLSSLEYLTSE